MLLSKVPLQLSCRPLQVLEGYYKVSPQPSLLRAEQPQLSQPLLIGEMFHPSHHFCGPSLDPLQQVHVPPVPGLQSWTQDSTWGLTSAEQRGRITSLDLLAMLLLIQPRIQLPFWVARPHCHVMLSFLSTSTPKSFSSGLLPILSVSCLYLCWDCPHPYAGSCTQPC